MSNIFSDKLKTGMEYMQEGIKVVKNEVLHQVSKKVSWLDSPYKVKNEAQTAIEKNIQLSSLMENGDKTMFDDRRII